MDKHATFAGLRGLLVATLLAVSCTDAVGPDRRGLGAPQFDVAAGSGIAFDTLNGTVEDSSRTFIIKGFNPRNPHNGDAIIATFFWVGSENIITSVTDHLTLPGAPLVGNTYTLVRYVTAGGLSMATYVATNVQNFPGAYNKPAQDSILAVRANLSTSVANRGVVISAWRGVAGTFAEAVGASRSGSGTASSDTLVGPGAIPIGAGALAYAVTMSNGQAGRFPPTGFGNMHTQGNAAMVTEADTAVQASAGSVDPQWQWFFSSPASGCTPSTPCTWLASVLALNPGTTQPPPPPPPPPPPTTGDLTVKTSTRGLSLDLDGYTVTVDGSQSQTIGTNGSVRFTGLDAGDHTVVLSDVAVNCTVSEGDTQTVSVGSGGTDSTTFAVTCVPGPATRLVFTVQPSNTAPNATISPAVKVKAVDAQSNTVTDFAGLVTIAIGRNGSLLFPGTLSGTKTVSPINGVATFSDLRIDQSGDGYTLRVAASGLTGAESAAFNIRALVCVLGVCL